MSKQATQYVEDLQRVARHAIDCGQCKARVERLIHQHHPAERYELLCQIERHEAITSTRVLHS